jgi:hypothetical protein
VVRRRISTAKSSSSATWVCNASVYVFVIFRFVSVFAYLMRRGATQASSCLATWVGDARVCVSSVHTFMNAT